MYSWAMPYCATKASRSRLCESGSEAESAVMAIAFAPSSRWAAQARKAESVPPEKAMMTRPSRRRPAKSCSCFSCIRDGLSGSTKAAIPPILLDREDFLAVAVSILGIRDHRRRRHAVAFFERNQPHTLRGAAGLANGIGFDADHLAVLADDHQLGIFLHREHRDHLAGLIGGLHVDDALAAA